MSLVRIRRAVAENIPSLCQLYLEFHEFHVRGVPDRLRSLGDPERSDRSELSARLREILADPDAAIFVAEDDGQCIGLAEVYLRQDDPNAATVAYCYAHLQSLMVRAEARRHGVGTLLLGAAEAWARERDAQEMRLDTWEFPGDPFGFYERLGYRTLRRKLVRRLE